jgi:type II secretory pathway predicted ATPase ExeA
MSTSWVNPKIIIGNTATGDYYFPRPDIEADIWAEVEKGNHVLLAAPRRVGKTSVMQAMLEKCPENTRCVFQNIQGIKSEAEYYEQLYKLLLLCLSRFDKGKDWLKRFTDGLNITEITWDSIKFGDKKAINFEKAIGELLAKIAQNKVRVVLLLDELPEVLNNLHKQGRSTEAGNILNHLRSLRQNPDIRGHLSLVLAGSVGIQHVVKLIEGRIADLNDFANVPFEPLSRAEAGDYISWATQGATVQYTPAVREHLLDHVQHCIPYFINLLLDDINRNARKNKNAEISGHHVDEAFRKVVKNSDHFKEWKNRLGEYFPKAQSDFMHQILVCIAHEGRISVQKCYDLAAKHQLESTSYMELMRGLEHDGYLLEVDGHFAFVSPFLREFWKSDNPVYRA